jgi:hypothetical protein
MAGRARGRAVAGVPYCHVVFTLPAAIADIAYQNKAVVAALGHGEKNSARLYLVCTTSGS